ncbi:MAG: Re/Si-specific NAD(P)(+) transhydrogenase subunit alpha [Nitrospirota bacterium]
MNIAIPKEIEASERRVAAIPETVEKMVKAGLSVSVESGAGESAYYSDSEYEKAGATIVKDAESLYRDADIVIKVQRPMMNAGIHEVEMMKPHAILISLLSALTYPDLIVKLAARNITSFAVDLIPRTTRAQRMDILSSMSSIAGYKAVLLAASAYARLIPMMTTSAGTYPPAKALILGAGVAGLQAIATAKRMGASVSAFDTRPAVKEQVQSLGATFVELDLSGEASEDSGGYAKELSETAHKKEQDLIAQHAKQSDMIITTALIPGKEAPLLIPREVVAAMKKGSVIVDMAVEQGGNCAYSRMGETVVEHGVTIIGATNLPATVPVLASQMYSKNLWNFLSLLYQDNKITINKTDEIVQATLVTEGKEIINEGVKIRITKGGS